VVFYCYSYRQTGLPNTLVHSEEKRSYLTSLKIGHSYQAFEHYAWPWMPGTSRSAASIIGGMQLGSKQKSSRGIFVLSGGANHAGGNDLFRLLESTLE
jgi:undecaprenyl pyrophosphate phosphatase UppP